MKKIKTFLLCIITSSVFAQVPPEMPDYNAGGSGYGGMGDVPVREGAIDGSPRSRISLGAFRQGEDKKWGIKNHATDAVVLAPEYDYITSTDGIYILKKGVKYGIASREATIILPVVYDSIMSNSYIKGNSLQIKKNGKWGSIDFNAEQLLPVKFFEVLYSDAGNGLSVVIEKKDDAPKAYFGDKKYRRELQRMYVFSNGVIGSSKGKMGFIKDGAELIPFEYDSIYSGNPNDGWHKKSKKSYVAFKRAAPNLIVIKNGKYGLADCNGNILYAPVHDKITYDYLRKIYIITKDKKSGVYFEASKAKTDIAYDEVYTDGAQFVTLKNNKKQGIIDYKGNWILPLEYDKATVMGFNDGFRIVKDGKAGWTDMTGQIIVQPIYEDIDDFSFNFKGLYVVTKDGKKGVINKQNNVVVPVEFEVIYDQDNYIIAKNNVKKYGVYAADGTVVAKPIYDFIRRSETEKSPILMPELDGLVGIIGKENKMLYEPQFVQIDYLHDEHLLVNPFNNGSAYRRVKDKNNKYGLFEEYTATMTVPVVYDGIYQKSEANRTTYFVAKKGKKFGVIDGRNQTIIPFEYDSITFNHLHFNTTDAQIVAVKNGKFGVINFKNDVVVPFEYKGMAKISSKNLYMAKKKDAYMLVDGNNKVLNPGPFDHIAQFEEDKALTFYNGQMRVINNDGSFVSKAITMQPHSGYTTFDELKFALVEALDSKDDALLRDFAAKVAPSEHILYFVKQNMFNKNPLAYTDPAYIKQRYLTDLQKFKRSDWEGKYYRRESLTDVPDFTLYREGYITVVRTQDHGYGDTRFMEKLLRHAVKINGYWISTYFMTRRFD